MKKEDKTQIEQDLVKTVHLNFIQNKKGTIQVYLSYFLDNNIWIF